VEAYASGQLIGGRISGFDAPLTANPNDLALVLNLILPLMVALFMIHRGMIARIVLLVAMVLSVIAIVSTFSRGGFLTLAAILVMYLLVLTKRSGHGVTLVALVALLLGVFLLPSSYLERLGTITHIESDPTGSAQNRWKDMVVGLNLVLQHPIVGAGVGMNGLALNEQRGQTWAAIHNVFLEYAIELGIPGFVLFVMLLVAVFKSVRLAERQSEGVPRLRELFHIAQNVHISLVAFTVSAMFHPVGYHPYFYYFGGLAIALRTVLFGEAQHQPSAAPLGGGRSGASGRRVTPRAQ
jgi:putative inorganic carbon (HCO3(-)) transporter